MRRAITGFKMDEHGDWVAFLNCGHRQHVRHRPPFEERPWVITEIERSKKIGKPMDCIRCDRFEMPDDFKAYRKTAEFNERTVPKEPAQGPLDQARCLGKDPGDRGKTELANRRSGYAV